MLHEFEEAAKERVGHAIDSVRDFAQEEGLLGSNKRDDNLPIYRGDYPYEADDSCGKEWWKKEDVNVTWPTIEVKNVCFIFTYFLKFLPVPTCLLHFILVEFRPFTVMYVAEYTLMKTEAPTNIKAEFSAYAWDKWYEGDTEHFMGVTSLWNFESFRGCLNLCNLMFSGTLLLGTSAWMLYRVKPWNSPHLSYMSAPYLRFTLEMPGKNWFHYLVMAVSAYFMGLAVIMFGYVVFYEQEMTAYEFLSAHIFELYAIHTANKQLLNPESKIKKSKGGWPWQKEYGSPDLNVSCEAFMKIRFTRTLRQFWMQTNDEFASKLITALWVARSTGDARKLRECVEEECMFDALDLAAPPEDPPKPEQD